MPGELHFGGHRLGGPHGPLRAGDAVVALPPKALGVLWLLLARAGEVVTKDELLEAVWPGTVVTDGVIAACLRDLRHALGDDARKPRFIATAHRVGYRFIAAVTTQHVVHAAAAATGHVDDDLHFVGREDELAQLHGAFARALAGQRQLVFVTGEAGIGKTGLVDRFTAALAHDRAAEGLPPGAAVRSGLGLACGQCIEHYGAGEPYLPVLEALGRLCRACGPDGLPARLRRIAPSVLLQLPGLLDEREHLALQRRMAGGTPQRLLRELVEATDAASTERPLVLVLEDMHWSDRSTVDWLVMLARRREPARLLVLATCRQVEMIVGGHPLKAVKHELVLRRGATELRLGPLAVDAVHAYVRARLAGADAALGDAVYRRSQGHPLYMAHVADSLREAWPAHRAAPGRGVAAIEAALPAGLRELIDAQIAQLDAAEQAALEAASVAGAEFAAASVAAGLQCAPEAAEQVLDRLARNAQFVEARGLCEWRDGTLSGRYAFRHALHRETLYRRLGAARRVALHARIGERVERAYGARASEVAAELASHFERARQPGRAARHCRAAAQTALQRHACAEALAHVAHGLALLGDAGPADARHERIELPLRLTQGAALLATHGFGAPEVERTYLRAMTLSQRQPDSPALAPVLSGLSNVYLTRAAFDAARQIADDCEALARRRPDPVVSMLAHNMRTQVLLFSGDPQAAMRHAARSQALYDPAAHGALLIDYGEDPGLVCHHCAALACWVLGRTRQALGHLQQGMQIARALGHPFGEAQMLWMDALLSLDAREPERLERTTAALSALCEANGFALWRAGAHLLRGAALARQGQPEAGIGLIERGLREWRDSGTGLMLPHALALLAGALAEHGRVTEALRVLAQALDVALRTGERWYEAELHRLHAEWSMRAAPPSPRARRLAARSYLRALAIAQRQGARTFALRAALGLARLDPDGVGGARARARLAAVGAGLGAEPPTRDQREASAVLAAAARR